jgi:aspartate dehydrogenase
VRRFPQNVNVAAAVSLAGIGFDQTIVRVVADPAAQRNLHRIEAQGEFGELTLEFRLLPSPGNPKTSFLAALSAIRLIRRLSEPVVIGA